MSVDITQIGAQKVKNLSTGEAVELKNLWENQNVAIVFFRRWGCLLCRLWAKELSEIAPVLQKNNIKLVGIGVEEAGSKEFISGKFFDGDLYYVDNISTYQLLGFKRFNVVTIITSLFWKQSREAISKGRSMGLGGDRKGDWVQTGGAILVQKGGNLLRHFVQTGPGDHLPNEEILKHFGLEHEYKAETMANKDRDGAQCNIGTLRRLLELHGIQKSNGSIVGMVSLTPQKSQPKPWREALKSQVMAPIHTIWANRLCKSHHTWV